MHPAGQRGPQGAGGAIAGDDGTLSFSSEAVGMPYPFRSCSSGKAATACFGYHPDEPGPVALLHDGAKGKGAEHASKRKIIFEKRTGLH